MSKDFDSRFQEMAARVSPEPRLSGAKVGLIKVLSIVLGFLFVSVFFALGVKLVAIGFDYPLDTLSAFLVGVGLSVIQLARMSVTWASR